MPNDAYATTEALARLSAALDAKDIDTPRPRPIRIPWARLSKREIVYFEILRGRF
jgi:hypothetical protein